MLTSNVILMSQLPEQENTPAHRSLAGRATLRLLARFRRSLYQLFTDHPHGAGESYLVHAWFTTVISFRFFTCAVALFLHGIFPFLFTTYVSAQTRKLYRLFRLRSHRMVLKKQAALTDSE
ncbi:hypothetical protein GC177_02625 [bacterium]|nr:hypothetical protein [bacterium]